MKLHFFHYYFREKRLRTPPRKIHDIRPLLNAYIGHADPSWKNRIEGPDGETLMLMRPSPGVYMLIGTRQAEIIKAVNTASMSCTDISERLRQNEKTGFAGYFRADDRRVAVGATLHGPRAAALCRFVNMLADALGASQWKFCMQSVTTSITIEQARAMAFVARASIQVSPGNPLFQRLVGFFGADDGEIASFVVGVKGRKRRNVKDVVQRMATQSGTDHVDKFTVRARETMEDDLADFYVCGDGRLSDDISPGSESHIVSAVNRQFANEQATALLTGILDGNQYDNTPVPELVRLGEPDHWRAHLSRDADTES